MESKGFYKLSMTQRIGFGSGDLAQNLIFQTVAMYLLFFYTNVFGIAPAVVAVMFLIVRIIDVITDPIMGAFVDKYNPKNGKYRSYLVLGGIPLTGFAILCFWTGFSGSLLYAYVTYIGLTLGYTMVNIPYGALNASLTRDTNEITKLTSARMFLANVGGLLVAYGVPIMVRTFSPDGSIDTPEAGHAWFLTMTIYALAGFAFLIFCYTQTRERVVIDEKERMSVKSSDLWLEFKRNRPLRVLAFFFFTAFAMMFIGNAAGAFYMTHNLNAPHAVPYFMVLGSLPALIFLPLVPAIKRAIGKQQMFRVFLSIGIVGMIMLYMVPLFNNAIWFVLVAQFVKSVGVIVATGYMWALVPEVISYGEYKTGRRISGIVNAITGLFFKAGMALGGLIPGVVLAFVGFDAELDTQTPFAEQGILFLVAGAPLLLLIVLMTIISKYDLDDETVDRINREIEQRHLNN